LWLAPIVSFGKSWSCLDIGKQIIIFQDHTNPHYRQLRKLCSLFFCLPFNHQYSLWVLKSTSFAV
jgi:hypothetical protein